MFLLSASRDLAKLRSNLVEIGVALVTYPHNSFKVRRRINLCGGCLFIGRVYLDFQRLVATIPIQHAILSEPDNVPAPGHCLSAVESLPHLGSPYSVPFLRWFSAAGESDHRLHGYAGGGRSLSRESAPQLPIERIDFVRCL